MRTLEGIATILRRNLVRLVLTLLAVALVTSLLVWNTNRPSGHLIIDCATKGADGNWSPVSCSDLGELAKQRERAADIGE
jgi:hypothetical protein